MGPGERPRDSAAFADFAGRAGALTGGTTIACRSLQGRLVAVIIARRTSTYVGVALLGGVVGVVVGLLMAPGPGDDTRRRIARRSIEDQELLLRRAEMGMDVFWDELDLPATA